MMLFFSFSLCFSEVRYPCSFCWCFLMISTSRTCLCLLSVSPISMTWFCLSSTCLGSCSKCYLAVFASFSSFLKGLWNSFHPADCSICLCLALCNYLLSHCTLFPQLLHYLMCSLAYFHFFFWLSNSSWWASVADPRLLKRTVIFHLSLLLSQNWTY